MTQIEQMEQHAAALKTVIERRDLALKLDKNREFRKVVLEDFCERECAKYAQLSADPALSAEDRANALGIAQASGHLRRWLSVIVRMGNQAEKELGETIEELEELRSNPE